MQTFQGCWVKAGRTKTTSAGRQHRPLSSPTAGDQLRRHPMTHCLVLQQQDHHLWLHCPEKHRATDTRKLRKRHAAEWENPEGHNTPDRVWQQQCWRQQEQWTGRERGIRIVTKSRWCHAHATNNTGKWQGFSTYLLQRLEECGHSWVSGYKHQERSDSLRQPEDTNKIFACYTIFKMKPDRAAVECNIGRLTQNWFSPMGTLAEWRLQHYAKSLRHITLKKAWNSRHSKEGKQQQLQQTERKKKTSGSLQQTWSCQENDTF